MLLSNLSNVVNRENAVVANLKKPVIASQTNIRIWIIYLNSKKEPFPRLFFISTPVLSLPQQFHMDFLTSEMLFDEGFPHQVPLKLSLSSHFSNALRIHTTAKWSAAALEQSRQYLYMEYAQSHHAYVHLRLNQNHSPHKA